jgi:hypothetical protein
MHNPLPDTFQVPETFRNRLRNALGLGLLTGLIVWALTGKWPIALGGAMGAAILGITRKTRRSTEPPR